jgi:hypothetical protein
MCLPKGLKLGMRGKVEGEKCVLLILLLKGAFAPLVIKWGGITRC